MGGPQAESAEFFVAGGTLPLQSSSYVERDADQQILASLLAGRFCYVLNSRQMGKSSLCVRTMSRLSDKGVRCAFIDITKLGGRNVTAEQWYAGMALEIGRTLGVRQDILEYWKAESAVGPMQRFFGALRHVVASGPDDRFVVFIDEIDSTRSLPFDTDEFFAGVRECFNRRVHESEFERLTFCFLGVAVPSDLIQDARTTPFNIGDRIYLRDFTLDESMPLSQHLGPNGKDILGRIHHWTNGHPYLTQSICRALMQREAPSMADVDEVIRRDLLEPKVRETHINLSDVGNRVLNGFADGEDVETYRANILSAFQKALLGKEPLLDDEANRITAVLKLSGLMRSDGNRLLVRNRIYQQVFGKEWIAENMPGQELRRQRRAYVRGVIRTTAIAAGIVSIFAFLAWNNMVLRHKAEAAAEDLRKSAREMSWQSYVSDMNRLPVLFEQNNTRLIEDLLARHENAEWRGPEWDYWNGRINDALWKGPRAQRTPAFEIFPDGKRLLWLDGNEATILDADSGQVLESFSLPALSLAITTILWDGRHLVRREQNSTKGYVYDLLSKKVTWNFSEVDISLVAWQNGFSKDGRYGYGESRQHAGIIDLETKKLVIKWPLNYSSFIVGFLPDNLTCIYGEVEKGLDYRIVYANVKTGAITKTLRGFKNVWTAAGPNPNWITINFADGWLRRYRTSDGKLLWQVRPTTDRLWISSESDDGSVVTATTRAKVTYVYRIDGDRPFLVKEIAAGDWGRVSADGTRVFTRDYRLSAHSVSGSSATLSVQVPNFLGELNYIKQRDQVVAINTDGSVHQIKLSMDSLRVFPCQLSWPLKSSWFVIEPLTGAAVASQPFTHMVDPLSGRVLFRDSQPTAVAVQLSESKLLRSTDGRAFELVDLKTDARRTVFHLDFTVMQLSPAVSNDGEFLALGGVEGRVAVINCTTWEILWQQQVHDADVIACRFSSDGTRLVMGSADDTGTVCDARRGAVLARLAGHAQSIVSVDFLPGDSRVVTASDDKTIRLWDIATGTELTTIARVGDSPAFVAVSADEKYILSATKSGHIQAWPLPKSNTTTPFESGKTPPVGGGQQP